MAILTLYADKGRSRYSPKTRIGASFFVRRDYFESAGNVPGWLMAECYEGFEWTIYIDSWQYFWVDWIREEEL